MRTDVKIVNHSGYPLPDYQTVGSAGVDLRAKLEAPVTLQPLERRLIPTGLYLELPYGYEGQVRPRSGLSLRRGLTCVNAVGTVDSDYRGELQIPMVNLDREPQTIAPGERIAQLVLNSHGVIAWVEEETLSESDRGGRGFGSTGTA